MRTTVVCILVRAFLDGVRPLQTYFSRLSVTNGSKKGKILQIVLTFVLVFSLGMFEVMLAFNYYTYQTLGTLIDIPYLGLFLASLAGFFFLFLLGSIGLSSIIYRGKDIMMVSTFPVREQELLISRLLIAYILYFPLYVGILLPALVVATLLQGVSILCILGSLALVFLGPLLPLSLALFVTTILVRLSRGRRFRMFEQLFSFVVLLGFSLVMITAFSRNMEEGSPFLVDYQSLMLSVGNTFRILTKVFPFFVMQAGMLWSWSAFSLQVLLLLVVSSLLCLIVGRGYERSLSLVASSQSVTRKKGRQGKHDAYRVMSQTRTLMVRELEVIKGQSVFMIEVVGELLIPLILLGVYALTGVLGEIQAVATSVASSSYLPYGLVLAVLLISSISMLSSTSVSRQGPQFALDKVLPVRPGEFVKAKLIVHLLLVGGTDVVYLVLALLFFRLSLVHLIWMVPFILLALFSIAAFGLAIDYKRPMLTWSIPQQAMKSNMNGLLGMGSSLGVFIVEGIALFAPIILFSSNVIGIGLSLLVATFLCFVSWKVVVGHASSALSKYVRQRSKAPCKSE